jgi:repressor LexA
MTAEDLAPTARQLEVLSKIDEHVRDFRYPPTIRWLMEQLGIGSTNALRDHLNALIRKGLLERGTAQARALAITDLGRRHLDSIVTTEASP